MEDRCVDGEQCLGCDYVSDVTQSPRCGGTVPALMPQLSGWWLARQLVD